MKKLYDIQIYWWSEGCWYWHKGNGYVLFSIGRLQFQINRG